MSHRLVVALAALVLVSACSDGTGVSDRLTGPNNIVGNPPPPAFGGTLLGTFDAGGDEVGKVSRAPDGLSLEVSNGTARPPAQPFRFRIATVEYNANAALTEFWMNLPQQRLPAVLQGKVPPLQRGRIHVQNGVTTGIGHIVSQFDKKNGGYWLIDMTQFTQQYDVCVPSCQNPTWVNCLTINVPVVAVFYRTVGRRDLFNPYPSQPSIMNFATQF